MEQTRFAFRIKSKALLSLLFFFPLSFFPGEQSFALESISLKTYPELAIPVPNLVDMTKLPPGKTFQIADPNFILQFFFDGRDIYGVILKRDRERSIYLRLCFFRSCEESKYDFIEKIVSPFEPPFEQMFFSVKPPARLNYQFQGLEYFSIK